jgi:LCP family protein required for cell wall assembly
MVAVGILLVLSLTALATHSGGESPRLVVGTTTSTQATPLPGPTIVEAPPPTGAPVVPGAGGGSGAVGGGLLAATGEAYSAAIPFNSSIPVPTDLQFMLVIGSDARPGEDIRRTNGDSIHLIAVNPRTFEGTIVGFPRDAWVEIPGRGTGKMNSALAMGGPSLMVDTVRRLTGLPIQYYALTGFKGLESLVDDLGGVNVMVNQRMSDRFSGAFFEQGWHKFNGAQALAFTRNRHDTANGDFGR